MTTPSPKTFREVIAPVRVLAAFTLLGVTVFSLLLALLSLVPADRNQLLSERSYLLYLGIEPPGFLTPLTVAAPVIAVLIVTAIGEPPAPAKLVTLVAMITLAVAALFGFIFELALGFIGVMNELTFLDAIQLTLAHLATLALAVVGLLVLLKIWQGMFQAAKPAPAQAWGAYGYQAPYGQQQQGYPQQQAAQQQYAAQQQAAQQQAQQQYAAQYGQQYQQQPGQQQYGQQYGQGPVSAQPYGQQAQQQYAAQYGQQYGQPQYGQQPQTYGQAAGSPATPPGSPAAPTGSPAGAAGQATPAAGQHGQVYGQEPTSRYDPDNPPAPEPPAAAGTAPAPTPQQSPAVPDPAQHTQVVPPGMAPASPPPDGGIDDSGDERTRRI